MAGSRHHILPRFLLRGFATRTVTRANKQDDAFVWVFTKTKPPYECNILKVAVENEFYGEGELNADPEITTLETTYAPSIAQLRTCADCSEIMDGRVIEFIVHLTARTKHVRDSIIDATGFLTDTLFNYFSEYANWRDYCLRLFTRRPEIIIDALEESLQDVQASPLQKGMVRRLVKSMSAEQIVQLMDNNRDQSEMLFTSLRLMLAEQLRDIVRDAHIRSLLKSQVSEPRLQLYRQLRWYIRRTSQPLILGDVGCSFDVGTSRLVSMAGTADRIKRVYLPVSSDCIIVGTAESEAPDVEVRLLNEAMAKLSWNYFVSSENSAAMAGLSTLLSTEAEIMTRDEKNQIITDLIENP